MPRGYERHRPEADCRPAQIIILTVWAMARDRGARNATGSPDGRDTRVTVRLDEGSLLLRLASDWRSLLPGPSAGVMQLLHPGIGAGVADHSEFFSDPFARVYRSIPQIWATLLAADGTERVRSIRDLHRAIKGVDHRGERYHAIEPEVFWWAHATFTWEMFRTVELYFGRQLTPEQIDQLYVETVAWYARYGMSMRPVPADYRAFEDKFDQICRYELDLTPAGARTIDLGKKGAVDLPLLPPRVNRMMHFLIGPSGRAVLFGSMPEIVRERFDIPMSRLDRGRFRLIATAARGYFGVLPNRVNRATLVWALRVDGCKSRPDRYIPPSHGARAAEAAGRRLETGATGWS